MNIVPVNVTNLIASPNSSEDSETNGFADIFAAVSSENAGKGEAKLSPALAESSSEDESAEGLVDDVLTDGIVGNVAHQQIPPSDNIELGKKMMEGSAPSNEPASNEQIATQVPEVDEGGKNIPLPEAMPEMGDITSEQSPGEGQPSDVLIGAKAGQGTALAEVEGMKAPLREVAAQKPDGAVSQVPGAAVSAGVEANAVEPAKVEAAGVPAGRNELADRANAAADLVKAVLPSESDEHASEVLKTLRKLDFIQDTGEAADETQSLVADGLEIETEVRSGDDPDRGNDDRRSDRKAWVPAETGSKSLNLGKPTFAMATHEFLQGNLIDLQNGPVSPTPGLLPLSYGGQPASQPFAGAGVSQQMVLHQISLSTSPQTIARDLGGEMIKDIKAGKHDVTVRLDPADLGKIEIKMSFADDGRIRAVFSADNPHTYDLLRRDADSLARTLADAGIKADTSDFRFDMGQGQNEGRGGFAHGEQSSDTNLAGASENDDQSRKPAISTRGRLV